MGYFELKRVALTELCVTPVITLTLSSLLSNLALSCTQSFDKDFQNYARRFEIDSKARAKESILV